MKKVLGMMMAVLVAASLSSLALGAETTKAPAAGDTVKAKAKTVKPPADVTACKDKTAGTKCEFKRKNGEQANGACQIPAKGGDIHCVPTPPAVKACEGKEAKAACVFNEKDGTRINGSCVAPGKGGPLRCRAPKTAAPKSEK